MVLVAPPPCEACASGQRVPPPPGVACRARRGIVTNRVRRAAAAAVKSLPMPPWGEACHPCTRQGVPPPPGDARRRHQRCRGVPPPAHSLSARFQATARLVCRPQCERSEFVCVLDHSRCDQLTWYSWPRRRARRALPGTACRHHPAWRAGRGVASPPTGCRRYRSNSRAKSAAASVGQGVPSMHPGRRAAATGRLEATGTKPAMVYRRRSTVCPLVFKQLVGRQASPSQFKGSTRHHLVGHCQRVEY